jgi:CheY-like chemotaxis protein
MSSEVAKRKYILYADDDPEDKENIYECLKDINSEVDMVFVNHGLDALQYLQDVSNFPCLILLDINMPVLNGLETLKILRQSKGLSQIPVIMFSTSSNEKFVRESLELGAVDYVTKPINFNNLKQVTEQFVARCD